ncbi:MAG: hypothetical protein O3A93_02520 [Chloroflexi bacterium]|nr:hypothetical protein [Chloroflexota bacterium]MDA1270122.1 hypothetical protein [Chloroflexota bacterium]PKB59041.1 MAG: hypothetical protein BZY83_03915 [SAR202 cluster bacterium Casp-Chloro-G2]
MTTEDPNTEEMAPEASPETSLEISPETSPEEQPERENPMFLISVERLDRLERSPVHLVAGRLAPTSPSKSKPISELGDVKGLIREIAKNYKNDPDFIRSDMPVQEIVFRTLLARGNRPMSLSDLHYELTERWATPIRPIVITEERLLRILDNDSYYGFARK